jgi:cobalt-zinc-cadmium efflux system outer membrane protein
MQFSTTSIARRARLHPDRRRPVLRRIAVAMCTALVVGSGATGGALAQADDAGLAPGSLTLATAIERALESGPSAKIARLESEQAEARAAAAESIYWPQASVTSQAGYTNRLTDRIESVDGDGEVHEYGLGAIASNEGWFNFMVSQVVFDLSRWKDAERARLEAEVAGLAEAHRRETTSLDVLEAYVNVARSQALIDNQRTRVAQIEAFDERAAALLAAGRCLTGERGEVALYLREARLELLTRQDQEATARRALGLLMGDDAPVWTHVDASLAVVDPGSLPGAGDVDASPDLRLLAVRRDIERVQMEAVRAGRYPVVALGGGYTHYGAYRYDNFSDEMRVGIDFRLPLFEGFRHIRSLEGAQKALAAAEVRYESRRDSKRARLQALAAGLDAATRGAALLEERERLVSERVRLAMLALEAQRGSVTVALAARREADAVVDASVSARFQPVLIRGEMLHEVGQLSTTVRGDAPKKAGDA